MFQIVDDFGKYIFITMYLNINEFYEIMLLQILHIRFLKTSDPFLSSLCFRGYESHSAAFGHFAKIPSVSYKSRKGSARPDATATMFI
jgi:hypothetical protein